ncbi:tetratricopeptide repeat protein [Luteitalea pratensis]|nr:tetratricopeptide repeat protein [Luteitalea pratensis]
MASPVSEDVTRLHEVVTFYSYKGGTGRTMALANAACLITRRDPGCRVLAVDWDLEAPGLHYYLHPAQTGEAESAVDGLVEYFSQVQAAIKDRRGEAVDDEAVLANIPLSAHCRETVVPNVHLMQAGRFDSTYQARLSRLDWQEIYRDSPTLFRTFASLLLRQYDVVLVDSRTGLTDISGICTSLLPDKVVVVFTANQQSLTGVEQLVRSSVEYRRGSPDLRPLLVYPLPSRIDDQREQLRRQWRHGDATLGIEGFQPQFERILRGAYALDGCDLSDYFNEVQVQHSPDYSYGEKVAALAAPDHDRFSIIRSYEALLDWLGSSAAPWETPAQARERTRLESLLQREAEFQRDATIDVAPLLALQAEIVRLSQQHRGATHLDTVRAMQRYVRTALGGGGDLSAALTVLESLGAALPQLRVPVRVHAIGAMLQATPSLRAQGQSAAAERLGRLALSEIEALRGPSGASADVVAALDALGSQLQDAAAFAEARTLREFVLEERRRCDGDERQSTLNASRRLAETHWALGNYATARSMLEHAGTIAATVLGEQARETLAIRQQLAEVLAEQGHADQALQLTDAVLEARSRLLGPAHEDTLATLALRSDVLRDSGRLDEARAACEAVVAAQSASLGNDNPDTLASRDRLAAILQAQGHLAEARAAQEAVVEAYGRVFGAQHPVTLRATANLAATLWALGALSEARALEQHVLDVRRDVLGPAHPETLTAMNNLASTLWSQGDLVGARALEEQALETRRRVLGDDHPATLVSMGNLAETLRLQGELPEAKALGMAVIEGRRRTLGPEHPETLAAMNNLALTLRALGDAEQARRLLEQVVEVRRRVQGHEHPDTLKAAYNLAETLRQAGDLTKARQIHETVLAARRRILGHEDRDTLASMVELSLTASAQDDFATARPLLEHVLEEYLRLAGEDDRRTLAVRTHLARALIALGDVAGAQLHQEHLASAWARRVEKDRIESGPRGIGDYPGARGTRS